MRWKLQSSVQSTNLLPSAVRCSTHAYLPARDSFNYEQTLYSLNQPLEYRSSTSSIGTEENENLWRNPHVGFMFYFALLRSEVRP